MPMLQPDVAPVDGMREPAHEAVALLVQLNGAGDLIAGKRGPSDGAARAWLTSAPALWR